MSFGITAAVIGAGAAIYGAVNSGRASENAANAQVTASNNANATQLQMYNQTRADQTPWRNAGGQAVQALQNWYGLNGGAQTQPVTSPQKQPNYGLSGVAANVLGRVGGGANAATQQQGYTAPSAQSQMQTIENTPGYQWQLSQGNLAVQRNLAAKGLLNSGAAGKALQQYGQGLAGTYESQYVSGLQSLAGLGQGAANSTAAAGMNAANQVGSNQIYAGNAQAYGQIGQANAINQGLSGLAGIAGAYANGGNAGGSYYGGSMVPYANAATNMNLGLPPINWGASTGLGG